MPSLVIPQGPVHYEVYGKGKPVLLLHGWLGSWRLWETTMQALSVQYRTYAIDFWGFGESGKRRNSYLATDYVELIAQFMSALGIAKAPLVGHSMGGTVSLMAALRYRELVSKVAIIGSPVNGNSLVLLLKLASIPWIADMLFKQMGLFRKSLRAAAPLLNTHPDFPDLIDTDLSRTTLASFLTSIASLRQIDLSQGDPELTIPILGMYGLKDNLVKSSEWRTLVKAFPQAQTKLYPREKHFPMLSPGSGFQEDLRAFLDSPVTMK